MLSQQLLKELKTHHPPIVSESLNGSPSFFRLALSPPRCGGVGARLPPLAKKIAPDTPALCMIQKFRKIRILLSILPPSCTRNAVALTRGRSVFVLCGYPPQRQITFAKGVFCGNFCAHRLRQQPRTLTLVRLRGAAVSSSRKPFACSLRLGVILVACRRNNLKPQAVFFRSRRFSRRFWPVLILAGFGDSGRF